MFKLHKRFNKVADVVCDDGLADEDNNFQKGFGVHKVVLLFAIFGTGTLASIIVLTLEYFFIKFILSKD